jgi:ABC-type glycerol-3-phosphate transport system substrate-binding protein
MSSKSKLSRRDFLRASALTAAGLVAGQCGAPATQAPPAATEAPAPTLTPKPAEPTATPAPPPPKEVTLEFVSDLGEYENNFRQLLDVFEAENPGIKVNIFSFTEDTEAAYLAKVAGGYLPAMEHIPTNSGRNVNQNTYTEWVNLGDIGFPWFDRWTYDVQHEWSNSFNLPGPRTLDVFQGIIASFIYHKDVVDQMGWDPQKDIKTQDDLERFLDELVEFAEKDPKLEFAWDRGWINGFIYMRYMNLIPVAFPDGSRRRQYDCWMGKAKFNAPDSPYRHTFEFSKKALERGWNSDGWWNREWEADQEATFSAKQSAIMMHGPWLWDKVLANDPSAQLLGFPFPSVDGKETILHMEAPAVDTGYAIRAGNEKTDHWEQAKALFFWWFSPPIVRERAQIEGRGLVYELDEPLELDAPQWNGLLQYVGKDFFSHVKLDNGPWGEQAAAPYMKSGTPGPWDRATGGYNDTFVAAIKGEITVQEALDIAQANWDKSYEGLPRG